MLNTLKTILKTRFLQTPIIPPPTKLDPIPTNPKILEILDRITKIPLNNWKSAIFPETYFETTINNLNIVIEANKIDFEGHTTIYDHGGKIKELYTNIIAFNKQKFEEAESNYINEIHEKLMNPDGITINLNGPENVKHAYH